MGTASHAAAGGRPRRSKWARKDIRVTDPAEMRRSILGTAVGNFMQWYDFGIYGYIATTIAQVFFPGNSASAGNLIATFGTLGASFVVRPLGGFIFGLFGDRIGRKRVLVVTILLMAAGTAATGALPNYHAIGIWAPMLFIVVRILQGLSTGGEYVGAMTHINEHASDRRRGMTAGFLPVGSISGYVVGAALVTGLQAGLSTGEMLSWGWRIPFLLGAPLGLIAVCLRLRIEESPAYEKMSETEKASSGSGKQQFRRTVVQQRKALLICIGLVLTFNITDYMLTGYLPTYLKKVVRIGDTAGLVMVLVVQILLLATVVFVAKLSDHIGKKPILWVGCGLLIAVSIPAFLLMRFGGSYPVTFAGVLLIGAAMLCFDSIEPSVLATLFPTSVRYGGLATAFNISMSTFGGTTPLIAQTLISATGNVMMPAYMLIAAGLIGVITLLFTPEVAGKPLLGSGPSVESEQEASDMAQDVE
jgi:MHS family proline/betaine transporter-like MFS transporter